MNRSIKLVILLTLLISVVLGCERVESTDTEGNLIRGVDSSLLLPQEEARIEITGSKYLRVGESTKLSAKYVLDIEQELPKVAWEVVDGSNHGFVHVADGTLSASFVEGPIIVRALSKNGNLADHRVIVYDITLVVDGAATTVAVGESIGINALLFPSIASLEDLDLQWSIESDAEILTGGVAMGREPFIVTGVAPGEVTIVATTADGERFTLPFQVVEATE